MSRSILMKKIIEKYLEDFFSDITYSKNEVGKYLIPLSLDFIELDWKSILSGSKAPYLSFQEAMIQNSSFNHISWANSIYTRLQQQSAYIQPESLLSDEVIKYLIDNSELSTNLYDILTEKIMVNIGIDTGDSCNDYTANTVPPAYGADHSLKETEWCASIVWLTKQQGHKKGELYFALNHIKHNPELIHTELMKSIADEVRSTLSIFTQLFFFVKMSIYELLLLNSLLQWHRKTGKWGGYIMLNKETTTGFYSSYVGSSSAVDIQLEREVKIPVKYISEILPDSAYRYPLSKIFESTHLWDDGRVTYMSLPKYFRMCMEEYDFSPLKKNIR